MSDNQQPAVMAVATAHDAATMMGFQNLASFEFLQRAAKAFALSTMVPEAYRAVIEKGSGTNKTYTQNDAALSNCMVALDLAQRMNASPMLVMQNLHVIEGRPSWGSPFIIALINNSGLFNHNLRFRFEELGECEAEHATWKWGEQRGEKVPVVEKVKISNARCVAWTKDKSGEIVESPAVTIAMAVAEGWYTRNGSKWRSMPQVMAQYRAAAFFSRAHCPELLMGLPSVDEIHDIIDVVPQDDGSHAMSAPVAEPVQQPRPPRAKSNPAPVAQVVELTPEPEPAATAVPAGEDVPEPAAEAGAAHPVVNAEVDTLTVDLFAADPAATTAAAEVAPPAQDPAPAPAAVERKPRAPKATPAPTPAPTASAASAPGSPPLTAAKIAFVKAQLDTTGGKTTEQFVETFGIQPDALLVSQFPAVLAWFKV